MQALGSSESFKSQLALALESGRRVEHVASIVLYRSELVSGEPVNHYVGPITTCGHPFHLISTTIPSTTAENQGRPPTGILHRDLEPLLIVMSVTSSSMQMQLQPLLRVILVVEEATDQSVCKLACIVHPLTIAVDQQTSNAV